MSDLPEWVANARAAFDEVDEFWGEAFVVTRCTGCGTWNVLQPRIGGDSLSVDSSEGVESYKKGSTNCRECGRRIAPTLTITYREVE